MSDLLVSSLSGASARQAVVEETSTSAWLFMTEENGREPVAHCFLYNADQAAAHGDDAPPPLDAVFASDYRVRQPVTDEDVEILWSPRGDAVAVRIHGELVGFIGAGELLGYSRSVALDCDWAHPFDADLFRRLFHGA